MAALHYLLHIIIQTGLLEVNCAVESVTQMLKCAIVQLQGTRQCKHYIMWTFSYALVYMQTAQGAQLHILQTFFL